MYEDLARAQEASLVERFVMTSVLPSLFITSLLHWDAVWGRPLETRPDAAPVRVCELSLGLPSFFPDSGSPDVYVGIAGVLAVERDDGDARDWQYGNWTALAGVGGAAPEYPELLRRAGVGGRVVVEAVVDSLGRVEPPSLLVVAFTHPGFVTSVQRAAIAMRFEPFRLDGRAMRVRIMGPIDFTLR